MLRFDPFRDRDRLSEQLLAPQTGTARAPRFMPMDLYKASDQNVLHVDLPGVDPGSIDMDIDNNILTIAAERTPRSDDGVQWIAAERPSGTYRRQLTLGDGIDASAISASYENGVLTLSIPVAERAKPRKISVSQTGKQQSIDS